MKLLDKKKTSELFEGVGSSLHQAFVGAVERDKNKTKELDCIYKPRWSGKQEYYKNLEQFHCKNGKTLNGEDIYVMTKSDVDNFLTQQRTELLEEIKNYEKL